MGDPRWAQREMTAGWGGTTLGREVIRVCRVTKLQLLLGNHSSDVICELSQLFAVFVSGL